MRRALKIKISFLLLAWMVIFAHNVIPHNHIEDSCNLTGEANHNPVACHDSQMKSETIEGQPSDNKVCHLSNLLFQNFNPETLFPHISGETIFLPVCVTGKIYIRSTGSFISSQPVSSVSFRGPPLA